MKIRKSLQSQNGAASLILSDTGNLEVWCNMTKLWTTNTNVDCINSLYFKNDGNIYLLGKDNNITWSTEISSNNLKPYMMLIEDNGNLAVYDKCGKRHWESRTTDQCPGIYFYLKLQHFKSFSCKKHFHSHLYYHSQGQSFCCNKFLISCCNKNILSVSNF